MNECCPCILAGWNAIAGTFGVRPVLVKKWEAAGAPILMLGANKPCAEVRELWNWLREQDGRVKSVPADNQAAKAPEQPSLPDTSSASPFPGACPYCGTTGSLRRYKTGWRCDWCKHSFKESGDCSSPQSSEEI